MDPEKEVHLTNLLNFQLWKLIYKQWKIRVTVLLIQSYWVQLKRGVLLKRLM